MHPGGLGPFVRRDVLPGLKAHESGLRSLWSGDGEQTTHAVAHAGRGRAGGSARIAPRSGCVIPQLLRFRRASGESIVIVRQTTDAVLAGPKIP